MVGVRPGQAQHVGEEALGQTVPPHDRSGQLLTFAAQPDTAAVDGDQTFSLQALDHLGHCRTTDLESFSDPSLDDVQVVFNQLENGFAVLLERRVVLRSFVDHAQSLGGANQYL